jgi:adenosine deaminase
MKGAFQLSKTLYADLHLHLGGAIQPRILWHHIEEALQTDELSQGSFPGYPTGFPGYPEFEAFFKKERKSLEEYLEMFDVVEPIQTLDRLDYFVKRLMRGAYEFENLTYIELRYCPYSRTVGPDERSRIKQMRDVVLTIQGAIEKYGTISRSSPDSQAEYYPIIIKQILCMHSQSKYSPNVNSAILDLAIEMKGAGYVCGIDIAGGEMPYSKRFDEILANFQRAHQNGLKTTAHMFETDHTPAKYSKLFPYLNRIGHGIKIPMNHHHYLDELSAKNICLEICPTTYIRCGTMRHYNQLYPIFKVCEERGVDITLGTDNSGMHMTRLQSEFENLLIHRVVIHSQLEKIRANAFKHAFGLSEDEKKVFLDRKNIHIEIGDLDIDIKF